jgi:hypothetical protein
MPLDLVNATPFTCDRYALTARNGATYLRVVLKGAYDVLSGGLVRPAATQPEIVLTDEYWGEPGRSAVKYESDLLLVKPGTDLLVLGEACAPGDRPVERMSVGLAYRGRWLKRLRVTGDREWRRGFSGLTPSSPRPFVRMPITYDHAFGGSDENGSEPRNRSGKGYSSRGTPTEGQPVPNIEWPDQLIDSPRQRPAPAGLGVIAKHWMPRLKYGGTYDEQWLENDFPLLPSDFDDRFFHAAAQDQWIEQPQGGEMVLVDGMSPSGQLQFPLPSCGVPVTFTYEDAEVSSSMRVETVLVDTMARTCTITWSADADIHGDPFRLACIAIGEPATAAAGCCGS